VFLYIFELYIVNLLQSRDFMDQVLFREVEHIKIQFMESDDP